jgi:hypothetical protein
MKTKVLILTLALANGGIERTREVLGGGAADSAAGGVALRATLGQPVVGTDSAGDYTLSAGFWGGGEAGAYEIYLPLVLRG